MTTFITAQNSTGQISEGNLSNPITANSAFVPIDPDSDPVSFTFELLTTDEDAKRESDYTISLVETANGDHTLNFRLSQDGVTYSDWGDPLTLTGVSISKNTPVTVHGQFRCLANDVTGPIVCGLRLPQGDLLWNLYKTRDTKGGAAVITDKQGTATGKAYIAVSASGGASGAAKVAIFTAGDTKGGAVIYANILANTQGAAAVYKLFRDSAIGSAAIKGTVRGSATGSAGISAIIKDSKTGAASVDGFPTFSDTFTSLDTDRWAYALAGNQTQAISSGEWVFGNSAAATDAFVYWDKQNYNWGSKHSIKAKVSIRTGTNQGAVPIVGIYYKSSSPAVSSIGTGQMLCGGYTYNTNFYFFAQYQTKPSGYKCWIDDAWVANTYSACTEITGIADNTVLTYILEYSATDGTGATPAVRFLLKNAAETTTYHTTDWVTYDDINPGSGSKYWLLGGKTYTTFHNMNIDIDSFEVY